MKTILCYGDSNTHGTNPHDWSRFDIHTRWPGVLRDSLGDGYHVIEEGCGGRTTVHEDPVESHFGGGSKNGAAYLRPCLHSHQPLDLVIILLGTNDLKARFAVPAEDIAAGVGVLVEIVKQSTAGPEGCAPSVLMIAPPPTLPLEDTPFAEMIAGGEAKSKLFGKHYAAVAEQNGVAFFDAGQVIASSEGDGLHWDAESHRGLGAALAVRVRALLA